MMAESIKKKSDTYTEILKNAKAEFLQNGFEKASMRSIRQRRQYLKLSYSRLSDKP